MTVKIEYFTSSLPHSEIYVDGCSIPYLETYDLDDGRVHFVLDKRFDLGCTHEEVERWIPFLANAMAIAAGMTNHGPNSLPRNPHGLGYQLGQKPGKEKIT